MGGIAELPDDGRVAVTSAAVDGSFSDYRDGLIWYDTLTGQKRSREAACDPAVAEPYTPSLSPFIERAHADNEFFSFVIRPPEPLGDVELMCGPDLPATATPTTTLAPPSSPTAFATQTATEDAATATASATSTVMPTQTPGRVYLPIGLRIEACRPSQPTTDVALVIDASTSMGDPARGGGTKLDAAREAVTQLLEHLGLDRGDQAAIVAFNSDATMHQSLTSDIGLLSEALDRIQMAPLTRIHRGVEAGHAELLSERHAEGTGRALVLLTDGRSNPEPVATAEAAAAAAKSAGIRLFTVGLGPDVEADALARMASAPADAFIAPDAADLLRIYEQIATAIPCAPTASWP
jgi:Mg-chelatase subunit ChlD